MKGFIEVTEEGSGQLFLIAIASIALIEPLKHPVSVITLNLDKNVSNHRIYAINGYANIKKAIEKAQE